MEDRTHTTEAIASQSDPRIAERLWFGALSVLAVLVLAASFIMIGAASPKTCESCHAMQTTSLRSSAHKKATCSDCHGGTNTLSMLESRLEVVDMTARQITGVRNAGSTSVDERRCMSCHTREALSKTVARDGLIMNHRAVLAKKMSCISCHPETAHRGSGTWPLGYSMDTCMACHSSNPKDIKSCGVCHTDSRGGSGAPERVTPWRVTHGPDWQKTHGMGDLKTCRACHEQKFCLKCHNVTVPHTSEYLADHGPEAKALGVTGRQGCMTCHTKDSCENCHGTPMPHPEGFLKQHSSIARVDKAPCMRCHSKASCEGCHTRHTHPGLPEDLKKQLLANPVSDPVVSR